LPTLDRDTISKRGGNLVLGGRRTRAPCRMEGGKGTSLPLEKKRNINYYQLEEGGGPHMGKEKIPYGSRTGIFPGEPQGLDHQEGETPLGEVKDDFTFKEEGELRHTGQCSFPTWQGAMDLKRTKKPFFKKRTEGGLTD